MSKIQSKNILNQTYNLRLNNNNNCKLKCPKYEIPEISKSGIHQIQCNDFDRKYIAQIEIMNGWHTIL